MRKKFLSKGAFFWPFLAVVFIISCGKEQKDNKRSPGYADEIYSEDLTTEELELLSLEAEGTIESIGIPFKSSVGIKQFIYLKDVEGANIGNRDSIPVVFCISKCRNWPTVNIDDGALEIGNRVDVAGVGITLKRRPTVVTKIREVSSISNAIDLTPPPTTVPTSTPMPTSTPQPTSTATPTPSSTSNPISAGCGVTLPISAGNQISVSTSDARNLASIVSAAAAGSTILLADGTYSIGNQSITLGKAGLTIRSASGKSDKVIIDSNYASGEMFRVTASNVTIAHLTIKRALYHLAHVYPGSASISGVRFFDVRFIDAGQQFLKINGNSNPPTYFADNGKVECSSFLMTSAGRSQVQSAAELNCYTGGIDAHSMRGWEVRSNKFEGIYCSDGLAEHAVHFWSGARDTLVENNIIINCARGIGFGLGSSGVARTYSDINVSGYVGHFNGIIRNNLIYATNPVGFDTGIGLEQARGARVLHNTVINNATSFFSGIDVRFSNTVATVQNNLVTLITKRDEAVLTQDHNVQNVPLNYFVDVANLNFHLTSDATNAINQAIPLTDAGLDLDGSAHDSLKPDLGAYEFKASGSVPPTSGPTTAPTTAPTSGPTTAPTTAPTSGPTTAPTTAPTTGPTTAPTTAPTSSSLLQDSDLIYKGAFKFPNDEGWYYPEGKLAFNPYGDSANSDSYSGSLLSAGHTWYSNVSEVSIPTPVISSNSGSLPSATTLKGFGNISGNLLGCIGQSTGCGTLGGLAVLEPLGSQTTPKLYWGFAIFYNVSNLSENTLGWSEINPTNPQAKGTWGLKTPSGQSYGVQETSGDYLFDVPRAWADRHLGGKYLITGNSYNGLGATGSSAGPAMFAFAPYQYNNGAPPPNGANLEADELLFYPLSHNVMNHDGCDEFEGGAWVGEFGKEAVLIASAICSGGCSYPPGGWQCGGYDTRLYFYNPNDLLKVKNGTVNSWDVRPYSILSIGQYFIDSDRVIGMSYDRANGRIYVLEEGHPPVVHVFEVKRN